MPPPVLLVPPAVLPVGREEVKLHCRVDGDDEDSLIDGLVLAATMLLDGYSGVLGRCLISQTWMQAYTGWCPQMPLPFADCQNPQVSCLDRAGVWRQVPARAFEIVRGARGDRLRYLDGFTAPALNADVAHPVRITFTAGYGTTPADVPAPIRQAIKLTVGFWYEHRDLDPDTPPAAGGALPWVADRILSPYRRVGV